MGDAIVYRRLRAPREDGPLVDPAPDQFAHGAADNRRKIIGFSGDFAGASLADLAASARGEFLTAALDYTRQYRDVNDVVVRQALDRHGFGPMIYLAGHQPELFHAGVWFKNFLIARSAWRDQAVAVNLVIDGDAIRAPSIRVPVGSVSRPAVERIEFDAPSEELPYEERTILDQRCWETFGARVQDRIASLVKQPIIGELWPLATALGRRDHRLGECLAQSRHQLEGRWGLESLEVPHSRVCRLPAYRRAIAFLLAELPRLHRAYNESLAEYRRVHRLRSAAHPAPDLTRDDDWLEAPFWIWQSESPRRRRLFVRRRGDHLELSDHEQWRGDLPLGAATEWSAAVESLTRLESSGVKIRPRALVTTMLARLLLGDIFVHGIGGAKYDQVTDAILYRLMGLSNLTYATATASLHLPIERTRFTIERAREIKQELRSLAFHPERYPENANHPAVSKKRRWIETAPTLEQSSQRCQAIRAANDAMQAPLEPRRQRLILERDQAFDGLGGEAVLGSREYSFCLFPKSSLQRLVDWA